jgi:glycosyltransferase involved in cell wall biosynthesis
MELLFWTSALFVLYTYVGYPAVLVVAARLFGRAISRSEITPRVTFIIAARNEAGRIGSKIANTLALDYPKELLEIIVASDCSDDGTDDIVSQFRSQGVKLVVAPERRGKEFAQAMALREARGEIIVFSDVSTALEACGVRQIVQSFADAAVGCVSSIDRVVSQSGQVAGEGAYVRYEMFLRGLESRLGSVVGLSGSFFSARREVCEPWPTDLPSDFNTMLNAYRLGLRGVLDPTAVGIYTDLASPRAEYARKVRTITRGIRSFLRSLDLVNPLLYGNASWQLVSHKLFRWLVPFALVGALASALALAATPFYLAMAALQLVAYGLAVVGLLWQRAVAGPVRWLTFFLLVNVSIAHAWLNVLRRQKAVTWAPSQR